MKKLINKLLIPTMLTSLTATMFSNCNVINLNNNINEINKIDTLNKKNQSTNNDLALMIFINHLLFDDCLTHFQKYYRLKADDFQFLTYKDIIEKFKLFSYEKYGIEFKINLFGNEENEYISTDKLHKLKINISLYKENTEWKILCSTLILNIQANDTFKKLALLKSQLEYNGYVRLIGNKKFNDANEIFIYLSKILSKDDKWKDIEIELNETYMTNSLYYCQNPEKTEPDFLANFVYLNLKINNYFVPLIITNLQMMTGEIKNLNEFKVFSNFNIFLRNLMPHINLKNKLLQNGAIVTNYTYQNFVNHLNDEFIFYWSLHEDMQEDFSYIKLNENQNEIFINGKNTVKLLIAKNENCGQYIEYSLPIYWHEGIKTIPYNDFHFIKEYVFKNFHYPNNNIIESSELKAGQIQKNAYNLILEKVKNKIIDITSLYETISLTFLNPNKLLENDHNIINAKIKFADYEFPIDFHIKLINT